MFVNGAPRRFTPRQAKQSTINFLFIHQHKRKCWWDEWRKFVDCAERAGLLVFFNCWVMGASAPLPRFHSAPSIPLIPLQQACPFDFTCSRQEEQPINQWIKRIEDKLMIDGGLMKWRSLLGQKHITFYSVIKRKLVFFYGGGNKPKPFHPLHQSKK